MAADREQTEPKRVDTRGLPLAERPRSAVASTMLAGYVDAELALAGARAPVDSLEAALAPRRSERRG